VPQIIVIGAVLRYHNGLRFAMYFRDEETAGLFHHHQLSYIFPRFRFPFSVRNWHPMAQSPAYLIMHLQRSLFFLVTDPHWFHHRDPHAALPAGL
jgi:hypothetical protein